MISPESTCHSMWQWNSHTPGLSLLNRITMYPFGLTSRTSRRMGTSGSVIVPFKTASAS